MPAMGVAIGKPIPVGRKNPYPASIQRSGEDYDYLTKRYKNIVERGQDPNLSSLAAQYKNLGVPQQYKRGPDVAGSMRNLGELSRTGGYSEEGIRDLRARGISPIRSVYQNAMQNVTRQRALQGGYSPNYTASMAKLARDLSESVSTGAQNVNAGIAENVAAGRRQIAPSYSSAALQETGMMSDIEARNKANQLSSLSGMERIYDQKADREMGALSGMSGLYGTTPATPALYGQQALQTAQLQEQKKARQQQGQGTLINAYNQARR